MELVKAQGTTTIAVIAVGYFKASFKNPSSLSRQTKMSSPPLSISPRWVNRVRSSSSPPPSSSHTADAVWPGDVKPTLGFLKKTPRRVRSISTPPELLSEEPVRVDSTHSGNTKLRREITSDKIFMDLKKILKFCNIYYSKWPLPFKVD